MLSLSFIARLLVLCAVLVVACGACPTYPPVFRTVTGCPSSDDFGTYYCAAGMTITISGSFFDPIDSTSLLQITTTGTDKYYCDQLTVVDDNTLTARLPFLGEYTMNPYVHSVVLYYGDNNECSQSYDDSIEISYAQFTSSSSTASNIVPTASSSSTGGSTPPPPSTNIMRVPYISGVSGCNNNATSSDTNNCDGESGMSTITVSGANFTADGAVWITLYDSMAVSIVCQSGGSYSGTVNQNLVYDSQLTATTPRIDKMDVDQPCILTVTHTNNEGIYSNSPAASVNSVTIQFSSYSSDIAEAFRMFGMSLVTLISVVVVVGIAILILVILCTLSCCCGVSLVFLNCCRSRPSTVVYSPQSEGYSSMA